MRRLIVELDSLAPIMAITITMGVLGYLAAIAIAVFGSVAIGTTLGDITFISFKSSIIVMLVCAVLRGLLRYAEQLSGHYIAFKILAILRDKVFTKLRKLAPAKLESKEKRQFNFSNNFRYRVVRSILCPHNSTYSNCYINKLNNNNCIISN